MQIFYILIEIGYEWHTFVISTNCTLKISVYVYVNTLASGVFYTFMSKQF